MNREDKLQRWGLQHASLALALCLSLSACGFTEQVAPYQRGQLAQEAMAWKPDAVEAGYRDHMHTSKAATPPTASTGTGGCGCN